VFIILTTTRKNSLVGSMIKCSVGYFMCRKVGKSKLNIFNDKKYVISTQSQKSFHNNKNYFQMEKVENCILVGIQFVHRSLRGS
jgi:hypothetical protein